MFQEYISNNYLRAIVIGITLFILLRIAVFIALRIILFFSRKTKTDLDDIIIKKLSMPLTLIVFLINIKIPIDELPLSDSILQASSKVFLSLGILIIGYTTASILDVLINRGIGRISKRTKTEIDDNLINVLNTSIKIVVILLAILYVLSMWGVEIGPLLAGLGIAGLAVALALQPVLSNIFSGISMIVDKSVRKGDLVYLENGTKGKVEKVGLRSTKINTFDNELIIIPNNKLAESQIQNVALPEPKSRVVIQFGVAYGSEIEKVKKIVLNEISKIKLVSKKEQPIVRFIEMGQSSLNFKVYFFVDTYEDRWPAIDEANTKIYNALNKAKIEMPFPQLDVHLKKS